jgi:hypothetical protein
MTDEPSPAGLAHRATHRIPGIPEHTERPAGHQGAVRPGRARRPRRLSPRPRWNHSPARPPRVLAAWQLRIAAFFGQRL